jgi:hypothetical protein
MPNLDDVTSLIEARLPQLEIRFDAKGMTIVANENVIAWERALSKKDMALLAEKAPRDDVLAIHVDSLETKAAWIASAPNSCFDSAHFANYPAVLIDLAQCDLQVVFELLSEHLD